MNERISIDPAIQHGKPVIRGTRVPVTRIVGGLAGGMTFEEVEREYCVTADDIRAGQNKTFIESRQPISGRNTVVVGEGEKLPFR